MSDTVFHVNETDKIQYVYDAGENPVELAKGDYVTGGWYDKRLSKYSPLALSDKPGSGKLKSHQGDPLVAGMARRLQHDKALAAEVASAQAALNVVPPVVPPTPPVAPKVDRPEGKTGK